MSSDSGEFHSNRWPQDREVDIFRVHDVLENGEAEGVWTFEEVHVGHEFP